jgi:threonine/homoserine/homoserine lactone efflux protein
MDASLFLRGLILGFSIAAPVGPIGVLCIRRTLAHGRAAGFVSGLGAASADALFGCVTAFGLTAISSFLVTQQSALRIVGGLFLVYLGVSTFRSKPAEQSAVVAEGGLLSAYGSTLLLTLTNPMTILAFAAMFSALGPGGSSSVLTGAAMIVPGVFFGSAAWWLLLSGAVSLLRAQIDAPKLVWTNRISGIIIAVFGILAVMSSAGM